MKCVLKESQMTATTNPRESTHSIVTLCDVSWETYERLRSADGNRGVRMTYDHGVLMLNAAVRRFPGPGNLAMD